MPPVMVAMGLCCGGLWLGLCGGFVGDGFLVVVCSF